MFTAKMDNLVLMQTTLLQVPFEQVLGLLLTLFKSCESKHALAELCLQLKWII